MTMHPRALFLACLMVALLASLGCYKSTPVYNPSNTEVPGTSTRTLAKMTEAIKAACTAKGWEARSDGPNRIIATHTARGHRAVVNIDYTVNTFSISYRDSVNLNYDGSQIHDTYNRWVRNLEQEIRLRAGNM